MHRRPGLLAAIGFNLASLTLALPAVLALSLTVAGIATAWMGFGLALFAVSFRQQQVPRRRTTFERGRVGPSRGSILRGT